MDQEVAQTLGELERKLLELERTLQAISAGEQPAEHDREPVADAGLRQPPVSQASAAKDPPDASQRTGWSRIVDETVEPTRLPTPAPPPVPRAPPPVPRAPRPRSVPARPGAPQPPSPAELLRFRDRLERAARELTHDYDELLGRLSYAAVPTPGGPTISFARGAPSLDIVDVQGLRDAAARAFDSDPAGTTAYGTSVGYPRLRSWIADRHGVEPERVLVTNGSMQADAFLFEQLVREGDDVIVERPTYDRTLLSLRGRGAQVHPVELQPDGINVDELADMLGGIRVISETTGVSRESLTRHGLRGVQPTLAHIIPNFQNPAGYTLSYEKRERLLALAAEYGFMVFEDDPYVELRFSGERLPTMLSMDAERVVYASSFSKTVCPGIRVGYLVGPPDLIAAIGQLATNTYISPSMVSQSIVYEFCASGAIERSIETVKAALAERARALANALRSELADAQFVEPQGGYFMWVTLPEGTDVGALYQAAAERGVAFVKGTDFLLEGGENTLRLAYSGVTPEQIDTGVARLAEAYRSL